jgi:hypothetical protein
MQWGDKHEINQNIFAVRKNPYPWKKQQASPECRKIGD